MRVKFNKYEKTAGIFVLVSLFGFLAAVIGIAVKKGWFESTVPYYTHLETGEGVREGTSVEMAGLRVGKVDSIELDAENRVRITLHIFHRFAHRIRQDSRIQLVRPYVVGEKVLYVTVGSPGSHPAPPGSTLESEEIFGLTDILNGRKLVPYMETLNRALLGLKELVDLLLANDGSVHLVQSLKEMHPLLVQLRAMSGELTSLGRQMGGGGRMGRVMDNLLVASEELKKAAPQLSGSSPGMGRDISKIVSNLAVLTEEFRKLTPAIAAVAPEMPKTSLRLVEAVDEAVVVLKALQRSFLLSGSSREVREEEARERRKPATSAPSDADNE